MKKFPLLKEISVIDNSKCPKAKLKEFPINKQIKNKIRQKSKDVGLTRLTMKFMKFIKQSGQTVINLKDVEESLKVRRRRIYDITNVIEGLGLIRKVSRSKIVWTNKNLLSIPTNEEISDILELEIKSLENEASLLERWNMELRINLKNTIDNDIFKEFGYFTEEDIKDITNNEDLNIIAIRAPNGTIIEQPDPQNVENLYSKSLKDMINGDEKFDKELLNTLKQKHQMFFNSKEGEIKVFLILASNKDK